MQLIIYGVGFWICTLCIQFLLYKIRCNHNHGQNGIWVGGRAIVVICVVGILTHNINYLAAVLGFILADEIGKIAGWH